MQSLLLIALFLPSSLHAQDGTVPASEVSIRGIAVGASPAQVERKLGKPRRKLSEPDFLNLHYVYPGIKVSFSDGVVAGLFSNSPRSCTPKKLCPGDTLEKMRSLYGKPVVADRETGRFFEYYGEDLYCWLQIPARGTKVTSLSVACQP